MALATDAGLLAVSESVAGPIGDEKPAAARTAALVVSAK
jgi:hypothetical protein